uniref:Actin-like ATPase domain-containing protein n=1 Tax=Rhizophagus irregularis (strain DAOM 181602 / DAOM 197198 / MUCL 43194) TaxID=747089 RepID=U9TPJ2_RHIID
MDELIFMFTAEAAAVYCVISTFVVVDCGGGTLDLTTRKLVGNNQLQLSENTWMLSMDLLVENNYDEFQSLVQIPEFNYELDIGNIAPSLLQYVSESGREWMEEWSEVLVKTNICKKELNILVIRVISISDQPISGIAHEVVIYGLSMKSNYCILSSNG